MPRLNRTEKKVAKLFRNAGFKVKTKIELADKEIDVVASFREFKLIIECTMAKGRNVKTCVRELDGIVHELDRKKINKICGLLVFDSKRVSSKNKEWAKSRGIIIWDEPMLGSYWQNSKLYKKDYASILIEKFFEIPPQLISVPSIRVKQGKEKMYIFAMRATDLLKIAKVDRDEENTPLGYQRYLKPKRLKEIGSFLDKPKAILANNIIVNFTKRVNFTTTKKGVFEQGYLEIPLVEQSVEVIDGQHRLYGFKECKKQKTPDKFKIIITGFEELESTRKISLFTEINDNQKRVPATLRNWLLFRLQKIDDTKGRTAVVVHRLNEMPNSPLYKKIRIHEWQTKKWIGNSQFYVLPKLMERELKSRDEKEIVVILINYLSAIKSCFEKQWNDRDNYVITKRQGINVFLSILPVILALIRKRKPSKEDFETKLESIRDEEFSEKKYGQCLTFREINKATDELSKRLVGNSKDLVSSTLTELTLISIIGRINETNGISNNKLNFGLFHDIPTDKVVKIVYFPKEVQTPLEFDQGVDLLNQLIIENLNKKEIEDKLGKSCSGDVEALKEFSKYLNASEKQQNEIENSVKLLRGIRRHLTHISNDKQKKKESSELAKQIGYDFTNYPNNLKRSFTKLLSVINDSLFSNINGLIDDFKDKS
ncbi:DGQHR domain-containing protein [Candidatus Micrarchaeota archaeon]|nr:DGQHR domain-containing protein [Candidatus Micrarchaeota archaeon]